MTLIPSWELCPNDLIKLNYPWKASPPNVITLVFGAFTYTFWKEKHSGDNSILESRIGTLCVLASVNVYSEWHFQFDWLPSQHYRSFVLVEFPYIWGINWLPQDLSQPCLLWPENFAGNKIVSNVEKIRNLIRSFSWKINSASSAGRLLSHAAVGGQWGGRSMDSFFPACHKSTSTHIFFLAPAAVLRRSPAEGIPGHFW